MGLYERLIGLEAPKLPVHQFMAAMAEFQRGRVTAPQIVAAFGFNTAEQVEVATLRGRVTGGQVTALEIHDVCLLAESGLAYTTAATMRTRFGV